MWFEIDRRERLRHTELVMLEEDLLTAGDA
jgi:hypothetical protein